MKASIVAFDRALVFIVGLLLIACGLIPAALYFDIPFVSDTVGSYDRSQLGSLPAQPWFPVALAAAFVVTLATGMWIVIANVGSRSFNTKSVVPAQPDHGETELNVQHIAQAACEHMASTGVVDGAMSSVAMVGSRPTVTFTVTADPAYSLSESIKYLEAADRDFTEACGAMDIDTVYKLHYDRINDTA
ncbi:hypothetical protein [Corynebacterium lipophiloflavum]|uniref:Alkaline shock response membrane anchor protein AmaP n=1 Tax=Corynebacterium lipophiloflavum (strain ATCC 700352 / DSM 44291 / CCUG 37336 / JCM 10383 / DMMZ 1944) TaxID=525263 RepID=C0XUL2_CORLD|nr:hypothetical protein [Corynebacterium lipophiloflavum]EEI16037.1 hypothetical protein HMPREF0298_2132 [Corynebacterium lipophiloflavum DSM 44291]